MEKVCREGFGKIKRGIIIWLFIQVHLAYGQQPSFKFKAFEPLSDFTSSKTSVIVEDSVGYLWIGTEEGLFRFDGNTVYPYYMDINNSHSLPSNGINNLVLDRENNLWVGTKEGIRKYDRKYDCFTRLPDKSATKGFDNKFVKVYTFDLSGRLYVAYNQVVYAYDPSEEQFVEVVRVYQGDISALIFDDQNHLWIGTLSNGGLFCFDLKKKQLTPFFHSPLNDQSISVNEIKSLAISGHTLWMGTLGGGIEAYDLTRKTFKHYFASKKLENYIISISIGRDKRVWVCTSCNLKLYDPIHDRFYDYDNNDNDPYTVGRGIQSIYNDREGNLWAINSFTGIRLARKYDPFKFFGGNPDLFWLTAKKDLPAVVNDKNGQFWLLKHTYGIDIYNWKKRNTLIIRHQEDNPKSITDGIVFTNFCDSKKQMWVGNYLGGLQKFNPQTHNFDACKHNDLDPHSIAGNDIRSIAEDGNGDLWLATHRLGVDRYDPREKIFYHYNRKFNNLCDQYTLQVFVDSRNNLWVATVWGLAFLRHGDRSFTNYHYLKNDTTSISNNEIQVIYEDRLKNIWVGTNEGLNKFNYKTHQFTRYSSGLKNKHVANIQSDQHNNIWVTTSTCVAMLDSTTSQFINYNQNYGLLSKEFYDRTSCQDSLGNLYFGGSDGYNYFNPDSIKAEGRKPKVVLTDFKLFNKSISCRIDSQIIDSHISDAKKISLEYFQNSITFLYQAITLTDAINIEYAYKLEGFDQDWVNAGKETGASYTNLNPGKYTFRVKAKYENGSWSDQETTIELKVHPAWWMSLWFKILLVILILTAIVAFVQTRIQRLQNQREKLKELVDERTQEINSKKELLKLQALTLKQQNDQLKDLNDTQTKLFSIIAHDLRGPFNVILGLQNILVNDYHNCSEAERIVMVKKTYATSQRVYTLVENLLSWSRIQTNGIQYQPVRFDLKKMIHRLDLYLNIAEAKGVNFANHIPQGLDAFADINLLETVLRNLISNAVKFTPVGGTVSVIASQENEAIEVSVIDTGIGMSEDQVQTLFTNIEDQIHRGTSGEKGSGLGLILCKEFIEKNKGTFSIASQPDKGSVFTFTIPVYNQQMEQEKKQTS